MRKISHFLIDHIMSFFVKRNNKISLCHHQDLLPGVINDFAACRMPFLKDKEQHINRLFPHSFPGSVPMLPIILGLPTAWSFNARFCVLVLWACIRLQELKRVVCSWIPGNFPLYFEDDQMSHEQLMENEYLNILNSIEKINLKRENTWFKYKFNR